MRGSPLIRALIAFVALLAFAPVIWQITSRESTQVAAPPAPAATGSKSVKMELTFTSPPQRVAVLHLGKEVWAKEMPAAYEEASLSLPWPQEGVELNFKLQWPEDARAAMRVRITEKDGAEQEQTVWEADKVLTFK